MKSKIETIRAIQILSSSKLIIQKSRREGNMFRVFRTLLFLIATISLLVTSLSCHRTPIEPEKIKANLIYEDALCTEAYLRLKLAYIDFPANVDLYVDKNKVKSYRTFSEDTVIMVENLLPKKSYTSYVRIYPARGGEIVSNEVSFTTMDTTSHNFTWQIFEFGDFSSDLFDVAIINENDIWAVGQIFVVDTSSTGYTMYNAVHWDGNKWELKQILYKNGFWPIRAVYAFNSNDIWFSGYMRYYNGRFIELSIPDILIGWGIDKIWGTSSNDIYAVGNYGNIVHWDGKRWKKIESGTRLPIRDIYGALNNNTGNYEILCVAADSHIPRNSKVLKIENGSVRELATDTIWEPWSIWFIPGRRYYHAGAGLWEAKKPEGPWVENMQLPPFFSTSVRGQAVNDVLVSGAFWLLAHWNGMNWQVYFPRIESGCLGNIDYKGNLAVVVGYINNKAFILMGRR